MECNWVICVVEINLASVQHALGYQCEKNFLVSFVRLPQNIKGVELLNNAVNSPPPHMWIILFQSFQFHDYFTINLLSLGVYHYCIMTCCQHVHWFLLIDRLILIGTIFYMTLLVLHLTVCRTQLCLYVVRHLRFF